jgi:3-hydroxyacyl-[acyl-carrier-protein] dehydratase
MDSNEIPEAAYSAYRAALTAPLLDVSVDAPFIHGLDWIHERILQRPPFLFVDGVQAIRNGVLCARFDVDQTAGLFAGHFPGRPIWPGVIQIEAMAQAGLMLYFDSLTDRKVDVSLGVVREARFMRTVVPGRPVQLLGSWFEDALFTVIVGQVLQDGHVCSASVLSGLIE